VLPGLYPMNAETKRATRRRKNHDVSETASSQQRNSMVSNLAGSLPTRRRPKEYFYPNDSPHDPIGPRSPAAATPWSRPGAFSNRERGTNWHLPARPDATSSWRSAGFNPAAEPGARIRPGDSRLISRRGKALHGGAPTTGMVHMRDAGIAGRKLRNWMEPVTDAEYGRRLG